MIAIVCPIGRLDRWGYQYHAPFCLRSMAAWADVVYLPVSCRDADLGSITDIPGLEIMNDEKTWFPGDRFEWSTTVANYNLPFERARTEGHAVILQMSLTSYIPALAHDPLYSKVDALLAAGRSFDWVYRRDQIGAWLTHTAVRQPHLLTTAGAYRWSIVPDSITDGDRTYRQEYGAWSAFDHEAIVDLPLELTEGDLRDKMAWFRNYEGMSKPRPPYSWGYWLDYYTKKIGTRPLDCQIDNEISRATRDDFISAFVLRGEKA